MITYGDTVTGTRFGFWLALIAAALAWMSQYSLLLIL